jgi:hypothetical protein
VSFEPFANPKGLPTASSGHDGDPLVGVAFACLLLGATAGFALFAVMRVIGAVAEGLRSRGHA